MKSRHSSYNFSPKNTFPRVINNQESERGERPNKPETNLNPFWLHLMSSDGQFDVFHIQIRSEMGKHVNHMNMQAIELAFLRLLFVIVCGCRCNWISEYQLAMNVGMETKSKWNRLKLFLSWRPNGFQLNALIARLWKRFLIDSMPALGLLGLIKDPIRGAF